MTLRLRLKFRVTSLTINSGFSVEEKRDNLLTAVIKPELIVNDVTWNLRCNRSVIITNLLTDES